jgi:hypothetical protein
MPNKKRIPSKARLEKLYLEQKKSTIQIGALYHVNKSTAWVWLKTLGIPTRPSPFALRAKQAKQRKP